MSVFQIQWQSHFAYNSPLNSHDAENNGRKIVELGNQDR